jgi:hypothetical protein
MAWRRWAERGFFVLILLYLGIGVVVGEHLKDWFIWLHGSAGYWLLEAFVGFHEYNPFGVLRYWFETDVDVAWERVAAVEAGALAVIGLLLARSASRLKGHFHDRHYRPVVDRPARKSTGPGDRPLGWWAVRRVTEYSGRINLWLASGFGILYALYTVAEPWWPAWLGQRVFILFEQAGGIPAVSAALVVLAAVPAAFQYGLWDSNVQDRCRRLELLLLTELDAGDYWDAAVRAAWRRGRGYLTIAFLLWAAGAISGRMTMTSLLAAAASATILWGCYFALGFRAFSRGVHANGLGLRLTVGLPLLAHLFYQFNWTAAAALVPPGGVYASAAGSDGAAWALGSAFAAFLALILARQSQARCERELRAWYDRNQGSKAVIAS